MKKEEIPQGHREYHNSHGEQVPSVTTVLKIYGKDLTGWANWLGKQGIDVKTYVNNKATYGTYIHSLAEKYFSGDETVLVNTDKIISDVDYEKYIDKFTYLKETMEQKGFTVHSCEVPLEGDRCGGTADILFHNKETDKYILLDFKTSKAIYPSMFIQLGGYTDLFLETKGIEISVVGIILIQEEKDSSSFVNLRSVKDNESSRLIFNKLLDIYYLMSDSERISLLTNKR